MRPAARGGGVGDGAEAFVAFWRAFAPTRLLGRVTDRWPLLPIAAAAYRVVLHVRPPWRRPDPCPPG